jgi:hypothetical protein
MKWTTYAYYKNGGKMNAPVQKIKLMAINIRNKGRVNSLARNNIQQYCRLQYAYISLIV